MLDLPAGASAVPLPLAPHLPTHTISFRCVPPPEFAAAAAADALPLWSRPVTVRDGIEAQFHLVVPVAQPPEPQQQGSGEQGDAAAEGESRQGSGDAAHLSAGASGDAAHLTAAAAAARGVVAGRPAANSAAWQPAVAILRLSVHRRGAGALHVVLESMQCDPPYLLENRTPVPLQYRQVRAPCRRLCKADMRLLRAAVDCRSPAISGCDPPHSPAPDACGPPLPARHLPYPAGARAGGALARAAALERCGLRLGVFPRGHSPLPGAPGGPLGAGSGREQRPGTGARRGACLARLAPGVHACGGVDMLRKSCLHHLPTPRPCLQLCLAAERLFAGCP